MAEETTGGHSALDETLRILDGTKHALSEALGKKEELEVELGELSVVGDEDLARGQRPDYDRIRQVQEQLAETKTEGLRLEWEIAELEKRAARQETEECQREIRKLSPQIFEKREQIRELEDEIGRLAHLVSVSEGRIMDLRSANVRRENYVADTKRRYEAALRGEPIPAPSVRRDSKGRLIQDAPVVLGY